MQVRPANGVIQPFSKVEVEFTFQPPCVPYGRFSLRPPPSATETAADCACLGCSRIVGRFCPSRFKYGQAVAESALVTSPLVLCTRNHLALSSHRRTPPPGKGYMINGKLTSTLGGLVEWDEVQPPPAVLALWLAAGARARTRSEPGGWASRDLSGSLGISWDLLGSLGISWDLLGSLGIYGNLRGSGGSEEGLSYRGLL